LTGELTEAYSLFINGGAVRPLRLIEKVSFGGDEVTSPYAPPRRVAASTTVYLVMDMMRGVLTHGTASGLGWNQPPAAGKTGSTTWDAWFVGFTPTLLTAIWVGFDDNTPLEMTGGQAAAPVWGAFMRSALAGHPAADFIPPAGVVFAEVDNSTGMLATPKCPQHTTEPFLTVLYRGSFASCTAEQSKAWKPQPSSQSRCDYRTGLVASQN
jgi:penicillin-binding protein 2D